MKTAEDDCFNVLRNHQETFFFQQNSAQRKDEEILECLRCIALVGNNGPYRRRLVPSRCVVKARSEGAIRLMVTTW